MNGWLNGCRGEGFPMAFKREKEKGRLPILKGEKKKRGETGSDLYVCVSILLVVSLFLSLLVEPEDEPFLSIVSASHPQGVSFFWICFEEFLLNN